MGCPPTPKSNTQRRAISSIRTVRAPERAWLRHCVYQDRIHLFDSRNARQFSQADAASKPASQICVNQSFFASHDRGNVPAVPPAPPPPPPPPPPSRGSTEVLANPVVVMRSADLKKAPRMTRMCVTPFNRAEPPYPAKALERPRIRLNGMRRALRYRNGAGGGGTNRSRVRPTIRARCLRIETHLDYLRIRIR